MQPQKGDCTLTRKSLHSKLLNLKVDSPSHENPQENISEEEEGDGEGDGFYSIANISAFRWQRKIHNHQDEVHKDQDYSKYTAAREEKNFM